MRRYIYLYGDPRKLDGWSFAIDRLDGHGPIMWPAEMREGDAAMESMVLCTPVGDAWQLTCVSSDATHRARLEASIASAAAKAGLLLYDDARAFAVAHPSRADEHLYEREVALDRDGKPVARKKDGAQLRVACCLAGDDPIAAADPGAAHAASQPAPPSAPAGAEGPIDERR